MLYIKKEVWIVFSDVPLSTGGGGEGLEIEKQKFVASQIEEKCSLKSSLTVLMYMKMC